MNLEWYDINAVTPEFVSHWRALGLAASTPNIYLMPDFVLPVVRHVEPDNTTRLAALWNSDRSALLALGVFNTVSPSWRFPYPRLSALLSRYSFQSGLLLRAGIDSDAIEHFVGGLFARSWRAVRFNEFREDSVAFRQLQDAAGRLGLKWFVDARYERAALQIGNSRWKEHISRSRHRRLQRAHAKLAELGEVEFRIIQGADVSDDNAETLLRLEAAGWKKASALLSTNARTQFFREMTRACRDHGFVFFCELLLDGNVIASTSNFNLNGVGFAFKVGNDPQYAKFTPGYLVEYASLHAFAERCSHLQEIESGSVAGSYIEEIWPERISMVSGHLVAGKLPAAYAAIKREIKNARRLFERTRSTARSASDGVRANRTS